MPYRRRHTKKRHAVVIFAAIMLFGATGFSSVVMVVHRATIDRRVAAIVGWLMRAAPLPPPPSPPSEPE
jgi:hypothetical protein